MGLAAHLSFALLAGPLTIGLCFLVCRLTKNMNRIGGLLATLATLLASILCNLGYYWILAHAGVTENIIIILVASIATFLMYRPPHAGSHPCKDESVVSEA